MKVRPKTLNRYLELARKISAANGGRLPNPWKIIQLGYWSFYKYMRRHPDLFSDFELQKVIVFSKNSAYNENIRKDHVQTAVALLQANGEESLTPKWLKRNGYSKLAAYFRLHPGLANTIKRSCFMQPKEPA